jgi:mannose/fructose/N-acetylgalactosamine-specific phosphotransferase system component IID
MRLSTARFLKILFSNFFIQTSWSFAAMQELGFLTSLKMALPKDKNEKIIASHKGIFNTHPYMSSYIIGATVRAYDEGKETPKEIRKFIAITEKSFASAGDLLIWQTMRPALLLMSTIVSLHFGVIGPITFFVLYTVFHLFHRIKGIHDGYTRGWNVIYCLKSTRFTTVQYLFENLGALSCGLLVSLIALKVNYLLIIPLSVFFILLLVKGISRVVTIVIMMLLLVLIAWMHL